MSKKFLIILSTLTFIGLGVFVFDSLRKTPVVNINQIQQENVANWRTYLNVKYGFEFKYPSQLAAIDESNEYNHDSATIYLVPQDVLGKIKNYPKPADKSIINNVWNALVATNNSDNLVNIIYNRIYLEQQIPSDDEYKQKFIDNYTGDLNGKTFIAKIDSFKKIDTLSGVRARIIIGEQWEKQDPANTLNQIFEADLFKGQQDILFLVGAHTPGKEVVTVDQFEKIISTLKLN
jgi:hypothetical protein